MPHAACLSTLSVPVPHAPCVGPGSYGTLAPRTHPIDTASICNHRWLARADSPARTRILLPPRLQPFGACLCLPHH
eukprot:scaffold33876_cov77-Phaeocystis_antarctica.AAC.3